MLIKNCVINISIETGMGTEVEILKSFGALQSELEQAKSSLKGVDENIKRLIGRDPGEFLNRPGNKRVLNDDRNKIRGNKTRNSNQDTSAPPIKRKKESVFKRLSDKPSPYEELSQAQKGLISKVIVTPREVPSRQEALAAQNKDVKSKERNRRMFGALLGTLQKFQQEETKLKQKEEKRAQLEKKIEEHEIKEKAEIKKEKQELFFNRKKKQIEIKMIELKMMRLKEYAVWEEKQKPLMNFIKTKTKPNIFYLPKKLDDKSKELLKESKLEIEDNIVKKKAGVIEELQRIEERMRKNFDSKTNKEEIHKNEENVEDNEEHEDQDVHEDEIHVESQIKENNESLVEEKNKNQETNENIDEKTSEDGKCKEKHEEISNEGTKAEELPEQRIFVENGEFNEKNIEIEQVKDNNSSESFVQD